MTTDIKTVQALVSVVDALRTALMLADASQWHESWRAKVADGLAKGEALLAQYDAVQPGWKLVPVEPTPEMIRAGERSKGRSTMKNMESHAMIWKDMLAAAPHPEAQALQPAAKVEDGQLVWAKFPKDFTGFLYEASYPEAQALDSQLQQPDGHSTRASGVCASTTPLPDNVLSLLQRARLYTGDRTIVDEQGPFAVFRRELEAAITKATKESHEALD